MTGVTDAMRKDFRTMQAIAQKTRMVPTERARSILSLMRSFKGHPEVQKEFDNFRVKFGFWTICLSIHVGFVFLHYFSPCQLEFFSMLTKIANFFRWIWEPSCVRFLLASFPLAKSLLEARGALGSRTVTVIGERAWSGPFGFLSLCPIGASFTGKNWFPLVM